MAPPLLRTVAVNTGSWALFLDFDGTLVDLAATPEAIVVPPRLPSLLQALSAHFTGALAVLTGRSLANLDRHLGCRLPAAGQHGAQLRLTPTRTPDELSTTALDGARQQVRDLVAAWPGLIVEDKGSTLAVHYRAVPEAGERVDTVLRAVAQASSNVLEVVRGKCVGELRPVGVNKGAALEAFLQVPPFVGRRPLMVGDDVTDEAGFDAALQAGGTALKVGAGESCAPWRLPSPAVVRAWLAAALETD